MSQWFQDSDPFTKVGHVRLIVVKHNPHIYGYRGIKDNCTQILNVEAFTLGFACVDISESRYGTGPTIGWLQEEITDSTDHKVNHLFKNLSNGLYELIGEAWHWSSTSYEGEWDGDTELRNTNIREISFNHAMRFMSDNTTDSIYEDMSELLPRKTDNPTLYPKYNEETCIHPYMTKHQILVNQANALTRIIESNSYSSISYRDSKIEDLENCIHMLMLQIDSEQQAKAPLSLEIDQMVQACLKSHQSLMDLDYV